MVETQLISDTGCQLINELDINLGSSNHLRAKKSQYHLRGIQFISIPVYQSDSITPSCRQCIWKHTLYVSQAYLLRVTYIYSTV